MPREWLAVVAAFLGGILVTVARGWLTKALEALGRRLQRRFSGSRMLHRRSLRKYRARVLADQEKFRPAFARDMELSMRDVYVPLRVAAQGREASDGAQAYEAVRGVRCAVVTGPPGSGKSMLLRHSMLLWASAHRRRRIRSTNTSFERIPVLVELHRTNTGEGSIRDHIVRVFNGRGFADSTRFADQALADGCIEVLLDGLDEVSTERRSAVVDLISDFAERYRGCRVMVTCRSAVYDGELSAQFPDVFEIGEFDERLIRRFLRAWPELPDETAVDALMAVLHEAPRIRTLAGNPLLLTMIAYLFGRNYGGPNQILPHSRAEFYRLVIATLLDTLRNRQNRYPEWAKRRALERLALVGLDASGSGNRLELPRATVRAELSQLWPDLDLPQDADLWSVVDELVERSGLLLAVDGGERFRFAHLTLQEYLAANALRAKPDALVERFRRDPTVWREVVKLWCGSVDDDATGFLEKIRDLDPVLALECLADARTLAPAFAADLLGQHRPVFTSGDPTSVDNRELASVVAAFGAVAADRRPRGAETFAFLERTLADGVMWARERAAAALAATNTPAAATALAGSFADLLPAVRDALVGMGDLAVHALARIAREGDGDAVAALGRIGTPAAAQAMVPLLWDVDEEISALAAWQLAHLVANPDVESALLDVPLPPAAATAPALRWVWAPFAPETSAIAQVMARVAYLLVHLQASRLPPYRWPVDPRLALPCVLDDLPVGQKIISDDRTVRAALEHGLNAGRRILPRPVSSGSVEARTKAEIGQALAAAHGDARLAGEAESLVDAILSAAGFAANRAALADGLDPASRRVLAAVVVAGQRITERVWRGIFSPRRETERKVYTAFLWTILALVGAAGYVAAALSAFGVLPWGPDWLRVPLAVFLYVTFHPFISLATRAESTNKIVLTPLSITFFASLVVSPFCAAALLLDATGPVVGWAVVGGAVASVLLAAAGLRWRAPANPVRDAILESRISLGSRSSVLAS